MKTSVYLVLKYWQKHKKNLAAVLFSGVLLAAVVFVYYIISRETFARRIYGVYEHKGRQDIIIGNSNDEVLNTITAGKSGYNYGFINVLGRMGNAVNSFPYGTVYDERDVYFIPLDEGRMPETADELAADRGVLDLLFWAGKCGDSIYLNGKTYSVVGIINEEFGRNRAGSQLSVSISDRGSGHYIPLIFIGESDETPLYRIDFLGNFFGGETELGLDETHKDNPGEYYYAPLMSSLLNEEQWYDYNHINKIQLSFIRGFNAVDDKLFLYIAYIGAVVSILSVFSALKSVFAERQGRIETLKKIGASKSVIAKMYGFECAVLAALQTLIGIAAGLAAYGVTFLIKTGLLGEKPYSGFANIAIVREETRAPFLYAAVISAALFVLAYLITVLTANIKGKGRVKNKKPRSISRCFGKVFSQGGVAVVQTAALVLICFGTMLGYLYHTDDGKDIENSDRTGYTPYIANYRVGMAETGQIDMAENGVEEYYFCSPPLFSGAGHMDNTDIQYFYTTITDYSKGIDDSVTAALPKDAYSTGFLKHTFIASDVPGYGTEIDLSNEIIREGIIMASSEEYKNFFNKGELGSKHLYQAATKLTSVQVINLLSDYVEDGEINVAGLNEGKETLVAYRSKKPPFKVGEKITIYSAAAGEENVGISDIVSAEITVGAIVKIPENADELLKYTTLDNREDYSYNFLTTATGARAMGFPCAKYTEVFTKEKIDGGIFPLSSEMRLTSLGQLRHENFVKRAEQYGGIVLVFATMSLLGFSAYFNGIGMKIRVKSYEISVMRAIGTPVSAIRKKLALASMKIPLIASAAAYGLVKLTQFAMSCAYAWFLNTMEAAQTAGDEIYFKWQAIVMADTEQYFFGGKGDLLYREMMAEVDAIESKALTVSRNMLFYKVMWQPKSEIPMLVIAVILCAVTFVLTALALKKFKRDIAFDLNSGRTRQ